MTTLVLVAIAVLLSCAKGRVEDKPVLLYVFINACSAGTWAAGRGGSGSGSSSRRQAGGTVHVAGHFFLHDPSRPIHSTQLQALDEAKDWASQEGALVLKSPHSGREWPLTLLLAGPWSNPHRHRYPGRLSAALTDLDPHMRYHDVLGVRRYLVYVEAGASALAAEPRVQAAVSAGRLRLVLWEEVPHFIAQDTQLRHPYASQVRPHASNPVPEYARKGKALTPCMRHMRVGNGTRARMSTVFRSAGQPMHVHV
eukprot:XP_001694587.1 predicted protein [Chlamydomonas reinhardtii]